MSQEQSTKSNQELIIDLGSTDGIKRQRARQNFVQKGEDAVDDLIQTFQKKKEPAHFEAAKALSQIGSIKTIETFIKALEDKDFSVRWVAAEGLVGIGVDVIKPLLNILEHRSNTILICEGVHHVLHDFVTKDLVDKTMREILQAVIDSYHYLESQIYIPVAAKNALDKL